MSMKGQLFAIAAMAAWMTVWTAMLLGLGGLL